MDTERLMTEIAGIPRPQSGSDSVPHIHSVISKRETFECKCPCHKEGSSLKHPVPCCEQVACGRMIIVGHVEEHQADCSECKEALLENGR